MKSILYKKLIFLGISGILFVGCSQGGGEDSAQISSSQSTEFLNENSSEVPKTESISPQNSEIGTFMGDDLSQLLMQPEYILLPTYFPKNETTAISVRILTNKVGNYAVIYTYERGTRQISLSGRIYETEAAALQNIDITTNAAVMVPNNAQEVHDLGHGITGYGEAYAGAYYFGWQAGNWIFTTHSLPGKESDIHTMAESIVKYFQTNPLPTPTTKGTVYLDFAQEEGMDANIHILWNDGNRVYEMNTIQTPSDAFDILLSTEWVISFY